MTAGITSLSGIILETTLQSITTTRSPRLSAHNAGIRDMDKEKIMDIDWDTVERNMKNDAGGVASLPDALTKRRFVGETIEYDKFMRDFLFVQEYILDSDEKSLRYWKMTVDAEIRNREENQLAEIPKKEKMSMVVTLYDKWIAEMDALGTSDAQRVLFCGKPQLFVKIIRSIRVALRL